ncbi:MAG: aminomethyl-transferring glycine dehydrogenase [Polyangiaceae bacterium]
MLDLDARFEARHLGSSDEEIVHMLESIGLDSLDELSTRAIPEDIRVKEQLALPEPLSEAEALDALRRMMGKNRPKRSFIGLGYVPALTPLVIQRNVLENPGWYTQYTPYQAEIAQGRLEALLNFQTMIGSLTGFPLANASLLDEATAAAEAMAMCRASSRAQNNRFVVSAHCHPQTIDVVSTRARALGIELEIADLEGYDFAGRRPFALLGQYPHSDGALVDPRAFIARAKAAGTKIILATCPLALCLLIPPAELGADVAVGSTQRFGLPLGFGGPHAAFLAASDDYKRVIPGRIVGVSKDATGQRAYRLALQTREQHIRRERATSNICTAQVLPAVVASFYAVFHGPDGLRRIATRVAGLASLLDAGLRSLGLLPVTTTCFDTLRVPLDADRRQRVIAACESEGIALCERYADALGVTFGEPHGVADVQSLLRIFAKTGSTPTDDVPPPTDVEPLIPEALRRTTPILEHEVFRRYHKEHELLRYLRRLESRDLSLTTSMIPLGSCTMKLNATAEMVPMTWPEVSNLHPFANPSDSAGYRELSSELERAGSPKSPAWQQCRCSPIAGPKASTRGLLTIRDCYAERGQSERKICSIPVSAHGTNPASAALAGLEVVVVACDAQGNVDVDDLETKAARHRDRLAALMVTYPSTHGVFRDRNPTHLQIVHEAGGQVYLDGANMNAQVGLCRPGDYGADVCHINLHKTFCIPHGGGGPGMGPIAVREHLREHLPGHPYLPPSGWAISSDLGAVSAAPYGSASVLPISWMYIRMMGATGLRKATQLALLNANYMAYRLSRGYPILYRGPGGLCAHEFIVDARGLKKTAGVEVDDIAKRLMDYGYHAPTMSFPVPGTLMIEPTESESLAELDRFCDAMLLKFAKKFARFEDGRSDPKDNLLKFAPHTAIAVTSDQWSHAYTRERAAFPDRHTREHKFWPKVGRIDNAAGDRSLICTCPPLQPTD